MTSLGSECLQMCEFLQSSLVKVIIVYWQGITRDANQTAWICMLICTSAFQFSHNMAQNKVFLLFAGGQTGVSLSEILAFWTGASAVPPLGFTNQLQINFVHGEPTRLPVSRTCGMVLELPRGVTDQVAFAEQMKKAINWTGGFHLI